KWAEVLSADAYGLFEELGVLNPAAGERFRREILGVGGSRSALESFVAFRGREPNIDALLRHSGMAVAWTPTPLRHRGGEDAHSGTDSHHGAGDRPCGGRQAVQVGGSERRRALHRSASAA